MFFPCSISEIKIPVSKAATPAENCCNAVFTLVKDALNWGNTEDTTMVTEGITLPLIKIKKSVVTNNTSPIEPCEI